MEIPGGAGRPALGRLSAFGRIRETVVYSATNVAQGLGRLVLAVLVILATSSEISSVLNFLLEVDGLASVRGIGLGGGGGRWHRACRAWRGLIWEACCRACVRRSAGRASADASRFEKL